MNELQRAIALLTEFNSKYRYFEPKLSLELLNKIAKPGTIHIDLKQATELLEMFGGQPAEISLEDRKEGITPGLYAWHADYPEEGSVNLGVTNEEAVPAGAKTEHQIIAAFLERTGQYVTNDATRKAAISQDADLQYRQALHCLFDVMRAANHALVGMPPSETEAKLRDVLSKAHDWYMAEVNSHTYMGEPVAAPPELTGKQAEPTCPMRVIEAIAEYGDARANKLTPEVCATRFATVVTLVRSALAGQQATMADLTGAMTSAWFGTSAPEAVSRVFGGQDISENVMDPNGVCPTCHQKLHVEQIPAKDEELAKVFNEFAEFVMVHNKGQDVPWPLAEMFVRHYRRKNNG